MLVVIRCYCKHFHFDKISGFFFLETGHILPRFYLWLKLRLLCLNTNVIKNAVIRFSYSHWDFQLLKSPALTEFIAIMLLKTKAKKLKYTWLENHMVCMT